MPANMENSAVATNWKRSVFIPTQRRAISKNVQITTQLHSSHTLAKYCSKFSKPGFNSTLNHELPDVQSGFRKGRESRDQIANICWIIGKAREFQKNIYFWFIDYAKAFDSVDHDRGKVLKRWEYQITHLPPEKPVCRSRSNS